MLKRLAAVLASADVIYIAGGAGVMQALGTPQMLQLLPHGALRMVCDGCLLSAAKPLLSVQKQPCSTDWDCPAPTSLARAVPAWGGERVIKHLGNGCGDGSCLLAEPTLARLRSTGAPPSLIFHNQFDRPTLLALRAWPAPAGSAARHYARALAEVSRLMLRGFAASGNESSGRLVFSPSCVGPTATNESDSTFVEQLQFYLTVIGVKNQFNVTTGATYSDLTDTLLGGGSSSTGSTYVAIDECSEWACNKGCDFFGQCSHCGAS